MTNSIKLIPLNANKDFEIIAEDLQQGKVNYFIGNDPKKWKTNIPTYSAVKYKEIYKGIDIKFYGNNNQMEYDIIVKPGGDPNNVKLAYEGIEGLKVTTEGNLEIALKQGKLIQKKPVIYQEINGKMVKVYGKFKVQNSELIVQNPQSEIHNSQFVYGFQLASYDKSHDLIIDPVLVWSTYMGGSGNDWGVRIATDVAGNVYIAGSTSSLDFPTINSFQADYRGGWYDIFVVKLKSDGSGLVYSTYIGGNSDDWGPDGLAVDVSGNVYVSGKTTSPDFPILNAFQPTHGGSWDAFVTKLDSNGTSLVYSTYLGGNGEEHSPGIAVDASGNAYVAGSTSSHNFPTVNAFQSTHSGGVDIFIAKLSPNGSIVYSTYLGGSGDDWCFNIAVDRSGNAYISGHTTSSNFPIANAFQITLNGPSDTFLVKMNSTGSGLIYSTYLGGSGYEYGGDIAIDTAENIYVSAYTNSSDFPTTINAFQAYSKGGFDAFITKLNSNGSGLIYSTYLGGNSDEGGWHIGIAVDVFGNAHVAGMTNSTDFPVADDFQTNLQGGRDIFVTKLNSDGSGLVYSTYLGGSGDDIGARIALDTSGNAYIIGYYTNSFDFPTVNAFQTNLRGGQDAFVVKIGEAVSKIMVKIDIKPGSFPNAIKLKDTGSIPVAIFSTATFDARDIDVSTLKLNGGGVKTVKGKGYLSSLQDVDGDGLLDLVVQFNREEVQLTVNDTSATVTGKTIDGNTLIQGTDSVKVIE